MRTLKRDGRIFYLSVETFLVPSRPSLGAVRLISGAGQTNLIGYNPLPNYVTVCSEAEILQFEESPVWLPFFHGVKVSDLVRVSSRYHIGVTEEDIVRIQEEHQEYVKKTEGSSFLSAC